MQAILEQAIAASRQAGHLDPQLMTSAPVQLLQSLLAVNPLTAAALVAHQISVQHILDADDEGLSMLGRSAGVPVHSLHLMRKQLLWGQPLELAAGLCAPCTWLCAEPGLHAFRWAGAAG